MHKEREEKRENVNKTKSIWSEIIGPNGEKDIKQVRFKSLNLIRKDS